MKKLILSLAVISTASVMFAAPEKPRPAAEELFRMLNPREKFIAAFSTIFESQLQTLSGQGVKDDTVEKIRQAGLRFAAKVADDPDMKTKMIQLYRDTFTEKEIEELIRFYATPTGKKAMAKIPEMFQAGSQIGQDIGAKYQVEFQAEIRAILQNSAK